jgi:hypothetical protein
MRKKPYPITDLSGGLVTNRDALLLQDSQSSDNQWVRFDKGIIKKEYAWTDWTDLGSTPRCLANYSRANGDRYLIAITDAKMFVWDEAGKTWDDQGLALSGDRYASIQYATVNDTFIFTNGVDPPYKYDGTTAELLVGGVVCSTLIGFKNRLLIGGTTEGGNLYPHRTRWTDIGTIETWDGGTSGYQDSIDSSDVISTYIQLGERCFMFKEYSIWEVSYVGGMGVFDIVKVVSDIGTRAPNSVAIHLGICIFWGRTAVYTWDGVAAPVPISSPIANILFLAGESIVNMQFIHLVQGRVNWQLEQYWMLVPTTRAYPTEIFKYSLTSKSWLRASTEEVSSLGETLTGDRFFWSSYLGETYGDFTDTTWRALSASAETPIMLLGYADGAIKLDDRTKYGTDRLLFDTKEFLFGHAHRIMEVRIEGRLGDFSVRYSVDGGGTWSASKDFAASLDWQEYVWYLNLTTQTIKFRVVSTAEQLEIRWIEPWYVPRVRSKLLALA